MNILCKLGLHNFPKRNEIDILFNWVVCKEYCCTEKNLLTGEIHKIKAP